jgi:hypothetical protein
LINKTFITTPLVGRVNYGHKNLQLKTCPDSLLCDNTHNLGRIMIRWGKLDKPESLLALVMLVLTGGNTILNRAGILRFFAFLWASERQHITRLTAKRLTNSFQCVEGYSLGFILLQSPKRSMADAGFFG